MMGQAQESEATTNQLLSLVVAKAGDALTVNVEAAGMTIPIVQHGTVKVDKVP